MKQDAKIRAALSRVPRKDRQKSMIENVNRSEELITPEKAAQYLEKNVENNRNVRPISVIRFATDMKSGNWAPELCDPIRFDVEGNLVDGQHRLRAIIEAQVSIPMVVVRNLPEDAIHLIDTGQSRRPADMLKISGFNNAPLLASSARHLLMIKSGPLTSATQRQYTHAAVLDIILKNPALEESCAAIRTIRGIPPSHMATVHYVGKTLLQLPDTAARFLDVLHTGVPAYDGCPAHLWREWLLRNRVGRAKPTDIWKFMTMVHVWNAFVKERRLQAIKPPMVVSFDGLDLDLI